MTDRNNNAENRHRAAGWLLVSLTFLPIVALLTYDWRAITALQSPPQVSANLFGPLGDVFAYGGYSLIGFTVWLIPLACVVTGVSLLYGRRAKPCSRTLWFLLLLTSLSSLLQVFQHHAPGFAALADRVNVANAGGVVGYLVMDRFLAPLLNESGASILMAALLVFAAVCSIGLDTLVHVCVALFTWAVMPSRAPSRADDDARPASGLLTPEQQNSIEAAFAARREAARIKEAQKAAAKAEKEAQKAAEKAEREARKAAEKAEREAERAAIEAARIAARNDSDKPPAPAPAPVPAPTPAPTPAETEQDEPEKDDRPYILPSANLLAPLKPTAADHSDVNEMAQKLVDTLKLFDVNATLAYNVKGPVVTKYALLPEPGTRPEKFTSLQQTLMMALKAKSLRIEAPIPGEDKIGIEVPNRAPAGISFREIFESDAWRDAKAELPLLFGKRADGKELVADLASMPHMLVAGATGQGKSVCLNSLICGLLMTRTPEQLKLIMVDPKCVEFTPYSSIPHLLVPVITDNRKVVFSLHWAVAEMEKRLKLFSRAKVKNIYDFNHRPTFTQTDMFGNDAEIGSDMPKTVPYIVIIIDEAADLIGQCGKEVNPDIQRITQKARAAGIHLILATQRPDAKIITGAIKANIPGRVAFKTASAVDSRTILDDSGAENLIGKGDMLFRGKDGLLIRAQGAWISDAEIANVTNFIEQHSSTQFDSTFATKLGRVKEASIEDPFASNEDDPDNQEAPQETPAATREQLKADENASDFKKAVKCIIETNRASTSHFQRRLGWGYNHSAKIMDMLEDAGVIGPQSGAGPRPIVMAPEELLALYNGNDGAAATDADTPSDTNETKEDETCSNSENP